MAVIVHKGPYEECSPIYEKLFSWIAEKGKRIVGPIHKVYLTIPGKFRLENILTEIYAPLN